MTPTLIVTVGPPGSGKTTWARAQGHVLVGRDHVRWALFGHGAPCTEEEEERVTREQRVWITQAWEQGETPCADDTSLSGAGGEYGPGSLTQWARARGADVVVHRMDTPLEVCLTRNAARPPETRVPDDMVREMWDRMQSLPA